VISVSNSIKGIKKMNSPIDVKRRGYLNFFKDGVSDALLNGTVDDVKNSSAYYKKGYEFGLTMYSKMEIKDE